MWWRGSSAGGQQAEPIVKPLRELLDGQTALSHAASSSASGMPLRDRHARTAEAFASLRVKLGLTACARSANNCTAGYRRSSSAERVDVGAGRGSLERWHLY